MLSDIQSHLSGKDPVLAQLLDQVSPPVIQTTGDVFHDLMSCVIEQQIHYRSSKKQFSKLLAKAGLERLTKDNFEVFEELGLVDVKLSARKYETMVRVLEFFRGGVPNWSEMSDVEVRKALSGIKGIGPWTVDMVLLYTLERDDIFPADDYHLKLLMGNLYELDPQLSQKAAMKQVAEQWAPYRSHGVKVLLEFKEMQKGRKR